MTAGRQTVRTVDCGGRTVTYTLTRKRVKNLNLRVRPDGSVAVSAAQRVPAGCVDDFVRAKSPLIFHALDRMAAEKPPPRRYLTGEAVWYLGRPLRLEVERGRKAQGTVEGDILHLAVPDPEDPGSRERAFGRAWDALCRREFEEVLEELYPLVAPFGVARPALRVRAMRSRWGSCHYTKGGGGPQQPPAGQAPGGGGVCGPPRAVPLPPPRPLPGLLRPAGLPHAGLAAAEGASSVGTKTGYMDQQRLSGLGRSAAG